MSLTGLWRSLRARSTLSESEVADVAGHDTRMHDFDEALKVAAARRKRALARIVAADQKYKAYLRGVRA
jgi:hypothetical protein